MFYVTRISVEIDTFVNEGTQNVRNFCVTWYDSGFKHCNEEKGLKCVHVKSNLSLYSLCYAEACNEFAGHCARAAQFHSKKSHGGGKPLKTLCSI